MRKIEYTVPEKFNGTPLYYFLRECVGVSTRIIQTLRHTPESAFINGTDSRVIDKVKTDDEIVIFLPEKTEAPLLWETELSVIYEDEDLLIINKPSGVSVAELKVSWVAEPPFEGMINKSRPPLRSLANAIFVPSGDHMGLLSYDGCDVRRIALPPLTPTL